MHECIEKGGKYSTLCERVELTFSALSNIRNNQLINQIVIKANDQQNPENVNILWDNLHFLNWEYYEH